MLAAAWLHDTVEDCGVKLEEISSYFTPEISIMVAGLTDISRPEQGNRAFRKAIDLRHTAQQPAEVQTIKLADIIDNSRSILQHDEKFARVYLPEKRALLTALTKGDRDLWEMAHEICRNAGY